MSRIVVVLKGYPRSDEIFIVQELVELERAGFEIVVYSLVRPEDKVLQKIHQELKANIVYVPNKKSLLNPIFYKHMVTRPFKLLELWGDYKSQSMVSSKSWKRFLQALWIYSREEHNQGLIYSHFANAPSEVAMGLAHLTGRPWFVFAHAKDIHQTPGEILSKRLAQTHRIFACNQESYLKLKTILPNTVLVYHGVKLSHLNPREWKRERARLNFYSAGRLVEKKGHDFSLRLMAELKRRGLRIKFDLFGDGPLRGSLHNLVVQLGLENNVKFHGAYSLEYLNENIPEGALYLGSFRQSEDLDRDGLPNTLLEAMYLGTLVFSADTAAIREALNDGVNGFLMRGEVLEWANQIEHNLSFDDYELEKISQRAQSEVMTKFNFTDCCRVLVDEFKKVSN